MSRADREALIAEQIAALTPGWDLAADVLDAWASGFTTQGETGKTLTLAAKDLRQNRDKVIESYVRNVGIYDAIADRNPTGGDVKQTPSRSDESGGAGTAIAHNLPPYPSTD